MAWATRLGICVAALGALYAAGWLLETYVIEYVVRIILLCGINAILAVGLNLINGTTGQFSIGHAGFMAVGAYATAFTVVNMEQALFGGGEIGAVAGAAIFNAGILVGGVLAGVAGLAVGVPSLRLKGDYLAIVTLGFGEIIRLLFNNADFLGGATGYGGGRPAGLPIYTSFFWVFAWTALVILCVRNLTFSSFGRALQAIREDEVAAEATGVPTTRMKVLSFVVSAVTAGVAGGLYAHLQSQVSPAEYNFDRSIQIIIMIIVGGLGSVTGAVLGAFFVTITLQLTLEFGEYRLLTYALLIIVLMIVRPQGILGQREVSLAWLRRRKGAA
jgi:branched-chain amino acid transport system permease protein